jgi:hypothetical protein
VITPCLSFYRKMDGIRIGLLGSILLASVTYPVPSFSQERTYTCARGSVVWVCVGQTIRLPGESISGEPRIGRVLSIGETHMNIGSEGSFLGEDLTVLSTRGVAVGAPPGSYPQTCNDVSVQGNMLYAWCRRLNGDWINTSLYFYDCDFNGVANTDGRLTCAPW